MPRPTPTAYLSHFRSALTALVIYHHTAASYGGSGAVTYHSTFHPRGSSPSLIGFNAINQSFFMGSFFFLSGYFTKTALGRKMPGEFVRGRLWRLGVPTVGHSLFGPVVCEAIVERRW